jgi:hypothetical protein
MSDTYQCLKYIDNSIVKVFYIRQVGKKIPSESVVLKILGRQTEAKVRVVHNLD